MCSPLRSLLLVLAFATFPGALRGETSEFPLALNLPTGDRMQGWDLALAFTHRFDTPAAGHGKDMYGLDGYAYPAFGLAAGIKPIPGLNAFIYRTADNKTLTFGLQQRVLDASWVRLSLRAERFDETVKRTATPLGTVGISGGTAQLPAEFFLGDWVTLTVVPTYISRTTTQESSVFTAGAGLRVELTSRLGLLGEYYPRPSRVAGTFKAGYAAGFTYKTFKHRFTVLGTSTEGTTANQVLSGDYGGGARSTGRWALGFNITRTF